MSGQRIILVPGGGAHAGQFLRAARYLKAKLYKGRALIVLFHASATFDGRVTARLVTEGGTPFSFLGSRRASAVITISHSGKFDGPISHRLQPWSRMDRTSASNPYTGGGRFMVDMLTHEGLVFWREVGDALADDGKIVLLGCNTGYTERNFPFKGRFRRMDSYAQRVASITRRTTYGATSGFAAANRFHVLEIMQQIERQGQGGETEDGAEVVRYEPEH